jgi:Fur family transcriptional regulator, zinc uptake regulator
MAHDHGGDLTRNQGLVMQTLEHAQNPLSAYDILDKLRDEGLRAPLQVYRALDKLVERGLAHRLESLNAFVACADAHCHKSGTIAFAICADCGKVDEFSDEMVKERLGAWAQDAQFKLARTTIELRGQCKACQAH